MPKPNEACMFCGQAPCQCNAKPAKPAPKPKPEVAEQPVASPVIAGPVYTGEYSNEISNVAPTSKPVVQSADKDMVYAVTAFINAGMVDKAEADRIKAKVGITVPVETKEAIQSWRKRNGK